MEKMNENETKDVAVQVRDYQTELEQIMRSNVSPRVLKEDAQIRLFLRVSAIARFQMKPVMAFFICGNTLLFFFLVF